MSWLKHLAGENKDMFICGLIQTFHVFRSPPWCPWAPFRASLQWEVCLVKSCRRSWLSTGHIASPQMQRHHCIVTEKAGVHEHSSLIRWEGRVSGEVFCCYCSITQSCVPLNTLSCLSFFLPLIKMMKLYCFKCWQLLNKLWPQKEQSLTRQVTQAAISHLPYKLLGGRS